MNWAVRLSRDAVKDLSRIPADRRELLLRQLSAMEADPFRGNVRPLEGKRWRGRYRKVAGRYRIIFTPFHSARIVEVSAITLRSEKTYR